MYEGRTLTPAVVGCGAAAPRAGAHGQAHHVVASVGPRLALDGTSVHQLAYRLPSADRQAKLMAIAWTPEGRGSTATARALETLVSYFELAQPTHIYAQNPMREPISSIPGLRNELREAIALSRRRCERSAGRSVSVAVAYLAYPLVYLVSTDPLVARVYRDGDDVSSRPPEGEDAVASSARLRKIVTEATRDPREATVRRTRLKIGSRVVIGTAGLAPLVTSEQAAECAMEGDAAAAAQSLRHAAGGDELVLVAELHPYNGLTR